MGKLKKTAAIKDKKDKSAKLATTQFYRDDSPSIQGEPSFATGMGAKPWPEEQGLPPAIDRLHDRAGSLERFSSPVLVSRPPSPQPQHNHDLCTPRFTTEPVVYPVSPPFSTSQPVQLVESVAFQTPIPQCYSSELTPGRAAHSSRSRSRDSSNAVSGRSHPRSRSTSRGRSIHVVMNDVRPNQDRSHNRSRTPLPIQIPSTRMASPIPFLQTPDQDQCWVRHSKWGRTAVISLVVQDTLYEVPERTLKQSIYFSDVLYAGRDTHLPLMLDDVTVFEMDSLLTVIDAPAIGNALEALKIDEWSAVLRLASKWGFTAVRQHAINIFDTRFYDQDPFSRLDLARKCQVSKWFPPAYRQLCERPDSLTLAEAQQLGLPQFVAICRIRDDLSRLRLEDVVSDVDGRLNTEEVSLESRCTNATCRQRVTIDGKPYAGMDLCRNEAQKVRVDLTNRVADMVADAVEFWVAF
ncbi:hypothetical protein FRB95_003382 [Tulasnella sp. JGI-2019a]|nr:hypothetical protein FRB95_003382 [Tulasnella sp. JGI-2019a]